MKRLLAVIVLSCCGWLIASSARAQSPEATTAATLPPANASAGNPSTQTTPTVYRDPYTGQLYQQELQTVDVPVTNWQRKLVNRTVVTPQTVVENQQVPQTYYVAKTEYVLQTKLKGWWNPFAQPTYAYEYVPVTRWVPQTQMVTRQVPTVKMLAQNEQVPVDEPVQTTQKVTQVVMRPLPGGSVPPAYAAKPPASAYASTLPPAQLRPAASVQPNVWSAPGYGYPGTYGRSNGQPLVASVPILGRQPSQPTQPIQAGALLAAPVNGLRSLVRATTAPFGGQSSYSSYAQPMTIASQPNTSWGRDSSQAAMQPTIVR